MRIRAKEINRTQKRAEERHKARHAADAPKAAAAATPKAAAPAAPKPAAKPK